MLESQVSELQALGGTVNKDAAGQPTALPKCRASSACQANALLEGRASVANCNRLPSMSVNLTASPEALRMVLCIISAPSEGCKICNCTKQNHISVTNCWVSTTARLPCNKLATYHEFWQVVGHNNRFELVKCALYFLMCRQHVGCCVYTQLKLCLHNKWCVITA